MRSSFGAAASSGGTIGCSCGSALCCSPSTSSIEWSMRYVVKSSSCSFVRSTSSRDLTISSYVRNPFSCPCSTSLCSSSTSGRAISTESMDPSFSLAVDGDRPSKRSEPDHSTLRLRPFRRRIVYTASAFGKAISILDRRSAIRRSAVTATRSSPTVSPWLFVTPWPTEPRRGRRRAARARARPQGWIARNAPSTTLSASPSPSAEAAQKRPSAPPFATQPSSARMSSASSATGPAQQIRVRAHRAHDALAAVERRSRANAVRGALERQREGRHAAAVDAGRDRPAASTSAARRDLAQHRLLARMPGEAVAVDRPALARGRARGSPACLPEQLCSIRVGAGPHSRSSSRRGGVGEQPADDRELLRRARGATRRASAICSSSRSGPRAHDRQRLERLRRRAEEGDERRDRPPRARSGRRATRDRVDDVRAPRRPRRASPRRRSAPRRRSLSPHP